MLDLRHQVCTTRYVAHLTVLDKELQAWATVCETDNI